MVHISQYLLIRRVLFFHLMIDLTGEKHMSILQRNLLYTSASQVNEDSCMLFFVLFDFSVWPAGRFYRQAASLHLLSVAKTLKCGSLVMHVVVPILIWSTFVCYAMWVLWMDMKNIFKEICNFFKFFLLMYFQMYVLKLLNIVCFYFLCWLHFWYTNRSHKSFLVCN
jgi:hypothetical protein